MARYTDAVCRLCRREGVKLFLKGDRCYTDKCAMVRRPYAPGQHGQRRKKVSEFGLQLREKQKARRYYGILETQFATYFDMANRKQGVTGTNLLQILESRLDNVVYRLGLGNSRPEARQLVLHGHFTVNGRKVNIPSYLLKTGDVVAVADSSKASSKFKELAELSASKNIPTFLDYNSEKLEGKVVGECAREEVGIPLEEHLIVELYSK
ncbi:MAG: 30S ribosomal protein S4 [Clostridia bacterium]|nr:30S ribosomal protein S4 [Clostridia bacterium]MBN2884003.1 30S ribosomal protein S4 [Clostridia bacterium]